MFCNVKYIYYFCSTKSDSKIYNYETDYKRNRKQAVKEPYSLNEGKSVKDVLVKFFNPYGVGTWLVFEAEKDGDDYLFFGAADLGYGFELGYFSLSELASVRLLGRPAIERDMYMRNAKFNCATYSMVN